MNPLLNYGHCVATISVYVFVENFETLRSHIFNNVKLRFRHENNYDRPECFKASGFGLGPTVSRYGIDDLIKFLYKREQSRQANLHE